MLQVDDVTVRFGERLALDGVVARPSGDGEVVGMLGPSGSGKSTLLRVVAGLHRPDLGRVRLDGRDLAAVPAHRRGIGMVFQDHALFPHLDVCGQRRLRAAHAPRPAAGRSRRACAISSPSSGLSGFERRSVTTLSGGEQQRVALARALAPEPRVLLLDEPLGSLDRRLRDRLLDDLDALFAELAVTALYVTHDQAEAFALGDRVAVLRDGRIVQVGTPDDVWAHPADGDVARFLGQSVRDGTAIRPESVAVRRAAAGETGDGVVESAVRTGPTVRLALRLDDGSTLEAAMTALEHPAPGDRVAVEIDPEGVVALPEVERTESGP